ncbi:N-acetylneuraminate lyase-like isoform X2 [Cimex lectularius]|nr:N-acetylneuraminate lyase-like isoform X2 [Cimex lectularius]
MTLVERKTVAEVWLNTCKRLGQTVMVQVGGASLVEVVALAKHAEEMKADAILCLPELFFRPKTITDLIQYLYYVSKGAPNTPLLYYHIPSFTGVNLDMAQFLEKGRDTIPTLAGIKFTDTDLEEGARCIKEAGNDMVVFLGADQLISAASVLGFDSLIATTLNLWPYMHDQILNNAKLDRFREMSEMQYRLSEWVQIITKQGSWVPAMKMAMKVITGLDMGPVRPPLISLESNQVQEMINELETVCKKACNLCVYQESKYLRPPRSRI